MNGLQHFFETRAALVLINRSQYEVLLDNPENPSELWSNVLFPPGVTVVLDADKPTYRIYKKTKSNLGLFVYQMRKV